jgi:exo-1,4-beta-D-glucosaminidase
MKLFLLNCFVLLLVMNATAMAQSTIEKNVGGRMLLKDNWRIQSSAQVKEKGETLSTAGYKTTGWYPAALPSTVVGALVKTKSIPIPLWNESASDARMQLSHRQNFANLPMPDDSPYRNSWWYRTEFQLPASDKGRNLQLHFDGINYSANIWLNGRKIADANDIAGSFRRYELDVTHVAQPRRFNTLAVEVFAPQPDDLALTWVDWNPMPPDKMMGLWHDVYLTTSGAVTLRFPQLMTKLDLPSLDAAHLTVNAELHNAANHSVQGTLRGRIEQIRFRKACGSNRTKQGLSVSRRMSFANSISIVRASGGLSI